MIREMTAPRALAVLVAALLVVASAGVAAAQESPPDTTPLHEPAMGGETEVRLAAGAVMPLADLIRSAEGNSLGLSTSFAVAGAATRWLAGGWGLALDALWATGGPDVTTAQGGPGTPGDGGQDGTPAGEGGATYLAGTLRVLYRLPDLAGVVEPRFGFGAGVRHVEMDPAEGFGAVSERDPVVVLSGAVRSPLSGRTALTVEMRDMISLVETGDAASGTELQNDILVLVGFSFRP